MTLTRKLRKAGGSVAMTIPRDFPAAIDLDVGDFVEIEPGLGTLVIRKAQLARKK